ncbi:putative ABC transporter ATP-binding protein YheS [Methylophaga muralis]|uniref:Putative ABC transporter ATP-binding protein YheS n=1 Tax=Methylophaga muralis TaxID=291169 RepID=A0A1E3GSN0_9GAMM|nr:putative ABC transporter ATP-binding protein YheS [Methylophaga muralis]
MINLSQLSLRRGPRLLFEAANLVIHPGQRIGLTGANGTGKSSLFAMIRNEIHADSGDLTLPESWVIAHVAQETPAVDTSAIDYVLQGDAELSQLLTQLLQAEKNEDGHLQTQLHDQLGLIDGYTARTGRQNYCMGWDSVLISRKMRSEPFPVVGVCG